MNNPERPLGQHVEWSPVQRPARIAHEGRSIRLEPLALRHAASLFQSTHEPNAAPELWDYLPYGPFDSAEALEEWITASVGDDPLFFAVCDPDGQARGVASLMRIDERNGVVEIGHVWLAPIVQRSRQATEAIFLLMKYAFGDLGYRRLEWKCDALNAASRRAAQRYGFTFEGIFRQAAVVKGRNRDTAWFAIIDTEWPLISTALSHWLADRNFDERGEQKRSLSRIRDQLAMNRSDDDNRRAAFGPIRGSCLCGRVVFAITAPLRRANYCHCSRCRKHSGAAALAQGRVARQGFQLLQGGEALVTYRPVGGMAKVFCSICGSSLFGGTWPEGPEVSVRLGTFDDDPQIRPQYHSFVGSKAPWEVLTEDGLPRFGGRASSASRPL